MFVCLGMRPEIVDVRPAPAPETKPTQPKLPGTVRIRKPAQTGMGPIGGQAPAETLVHTTFLRTSTFSRLPGSSAELALADRDRAPTKATNEASATPWLPSALAKKLQSSLHISVAMKKRKLIKDIATYPPDDGLKRAA